MRSRAAALLAIPFCLALFLSIERRANAGGAVPELVSADWSVNAAHNLASNPPSLDAVKDFTKRAIGESEENRLDVCEFRFADLRSSGNLSLIVSIAPGRFGCTELHVVDRTRTGFEVYSPTWAAVAGRELAHSVLDINHDGRHELVLWGPLAPYAAGTAFGELGCDAEWPLIFAWMGNGYSEVGDQYKDYYRKYLKSVETRLAAYSSELGPAGAQTANPAPMAGSARIAGQTYTEASSGPGVEVSAPAPQLSLSQITAPSPTPEAAATPEWAALNQARREYPCARIEVAKTEAFLGIDSASTMSAAIKDSESDNPNDRIVAAVIFSYLETREAGEDLKTLSNDADSRVADAAKTAASFGEDPRPIARTLSRERDLYIHLSDPQRSKP